jgi:sRNA-binding regulator protein Hfq
MPPPRDLTLERYRTAPAVHLVLTDGTTLCAALHTIGMYDFTLLDGRTIAKLACIGVFPRTMVTRLPPPTPLVDAIATQRTARVQYAKIRRLQARKHLGCRLHVRLVNGWELEGTVVALNAYHLALRVATQQRVDVFRHAIVDYTILTMAPERPADHARGPQRQQRAARCATARRPPSHPVFPWPTLSSEETRRAMINAKLKLVLHTVPAPDREVAGLFWIPLENQPTAVPGNVELPPTPVDLLLPKKLWQRATVRAEAVRVETGTAPLHIIEALIGIKDGRLVAVASGIQVLPGKTAATASHGDLRSTTAGRG